MSQEEKYIHVGLGKTATTTLQRKVFPKLCDLLEYEFLRSRCMQIDKHLIKLHLNRKPSKLNLPKKVFISSEGLHSWDPYYWEEYAKKNLTAFGSNANIILTLREPKGYLTSVYVQHIHQGENILPNQFFFGI